MDDVSARRRGGQGDHVGAGAAQLAADLADSQRDEHERPFDGELRQRICEHDGEGGRAIASDRVVAWCAADGRDATKREHDIADAFLANHDEVGPDRHHGSVDRSTGSGTDGDGIGPFGEIEEHTDDARLFAGLPFEPPPAGSFGCRGLDPALGQPCPQAGQWVVAGQPRRLLRGFSVHERRGYRYHSG